MHTRSAPFRVAAAPGILSESERSRFTAEVEGAFPPALLLEGRAACERLTSLLRYAVRRGPPNEEKLLTASRSNTSDKVSAGAAASGT
ncbi:hypothetical protein cyc_02911 [Cyclospora cayetanensis]|uniref:Uncharacterized protein n=1 Tax=Cyclospora cayetanensis TaxID=88456 RepID=A0A1D3CYH1_9EIME|nr:hypothetical protein cyc_02911 [Cyclospora cayetanensis]